jgi:hypothetical protein
MAQVANVIPPKPSAPVRQKKDVEIQSEKLAHSQKHKVHRTLI